MDVTGGQSGAGGDGALSSVAVLIPGTCHSGTKRKTERKTVAVHVVDGLTLDVERGPNCLFVKLRTKEAPTARVPQIAEKLWSIASRHFIYRMVLELDDMDAMPAEMMAELVLLQARLAQFGGALRICGMSPECEETLQSCQMDTAITNHATRAEAVMGGEGSGEYAAMSSSSDSEYYN